MHSLIQQTFIRHPCVKHCSRHWRSLPSESLNSLSVFSSVFVSAVPLFQSLSRHMSCSICEPLYKGSAHSPFSSCFLSLVDVVFPHYHILCFIQSSCHNIFTFSQLIFFFFFLGKSQKKGKVHTKAYKALKICAPTYLFELLTFY